MTLRIAHPVKDISGVSRDESLRWTVALEGEEDQLPVEYYWGEVELTDFMPLDNQTRPILVKTLTLHALFYFFSHFDRGVIQHLVEFCLGATGNCNVDLWDLIFRCGFPESAFKEGQQMARNIHRSDMFVAPMFPGGSHLLDSRRDYEFEEIEGAVLPSAVDRDYLSSPYSVRAMVDECGNVIFPLCSLNDKEKAVSFLTNYFEGLLRHLWSDQFENMEPLMEMTVVVVDKASRIFNKQWAGALAAYRKIRDQNLKDRARERKVANAKNLTTIFASSQTGEIEEFPACIETTINNIILRAPSHPKDPERFLLGGSLAFRMEENALIQLMRKLDTDGTAEGEKNLKARNKKVTPSCSSTISNGLCPFDSDAERTKMCYSKMGTQTFRSPVHLLVGK